MDACIYDAAEIWSPTDQQKTSRFQELHAPLIFNAESFQNASWKVPDEKGSFIWDAPKDQTFLGRKWGSGSKTIIFSLS